VILLPSCLDLLVEDEALTSWTHTGCATSSWALTSGDLLVGCQGPRSRIVWRLDTFLKLPNGLPEATICFSALRTESRRMAL